MLEGLVFHTSDQAHEEGILYVGNEQADNARFIRPQGTGSGVGPVGQRLNGGLYALAHLVLDGGAVVQHPGHGGYRYPCVLCYILNIGHGGGIGPRGMIEVVKPFSC